MISQETRQKWADRVEAVIEAAQSGRLEFNEWEEAFIESLDRRLSAGADLTMKQSLKLNEIYMRITWKSF